MKRILVVEDDPQLLEFCREILDTYLEDCQLECLDDGSAALARFREEPFDLVVTDCNVPGLDGRELYVGVRDFCRATGREVPGFIFCSAVAKALETIPSFAGQTNARQLLKPFSIADLVDMVREMTGASGDPP
ncbi:MAG: response regulator [Kiritimatiellae bacterium]|nr:response regulator [Kiritimatiellia bacterium]